MMITSVGVSTGVGLTADPIPTLPESLTCYLQELGSIERLSREQEHHLFARVQAGDAEAKRQCIEANVRLVVFVAKGYQHYCNATVAFEDVVQEGTFGLIRAIEKYDPERGTFSNYAVSWIKQAISRALVNQKRTIRLPAYLWPVLSRMARLSARLFEEQGHEPTAAQLAEAMDLSVEQVERLKEIDLLPLSLSQPITSHDERTTLADTLVDPEAHPPEEEVVARLEASAFSKALHQALTCLTGQERHALVLRYGLDGTGERTLREVGEVLGISRERVRQLEARACEKLRAHFAPGGVPSWPLS